MAITFSIHPFRTGCSKTRSTGWATADCPRPCGSLPHPILEPAHPFTAHDGIGLRRRRELQLEPSSQPGIDLADRLDIDQQLPVDPIELSWIHRSLQVLERVVE